MSIKSNKSALAAARAEKKEALARYRFIANQARKAEIEVLDTLVDVLRNADKPMTARELAANGVPLSTYEIAGNLCFGDHIHLNTRRKNEKVKVNRNKTIVRMYAEILEDGTVDKSHIVTRKEYLPNSYEIIKY